MAGVRIEITPSGFPELERLMAAIAGNLANMEPALTSIGEHIVSLAKFNFRDERGPDGGLWPESKRARDEAGQTLSLTARLKNSLTTPEAITVSGDGVRVGTNVEYAAAHQSGFEGVVHVPAHERRITQAFGKKLKEPKTIVVRGFSFTQHLPARPYLPRTMEEIGVGAVERILVGHVMGGTNA